MQVPSPLLLLVGHLKAWPHPKPRRGPACASPAELSPRGPPFGNLSAVLEPRAAAAVVPRETDVRAAPVNKAGEGGDWVTPVKYRKINTRTVGILQVN